MRARRIQLGIALVALSISGFAQVDPHPKEVHRLATVSSMKDFSLASVEFQDLRPGHEGPSYAKMAGEPPKATRQIAEIRLYSQSAVRTVRFEAIDATGRMIASLPAIRVDHDPEDGEYMVLVDVPQQPFRIRAAGVDAAGAAYERVYRRLFQPGAAKPAPVSDPFESELMARFELERRSHPDGTVTLSAIEVSAVGYEPFISNATASGIRVWYSVRFAADGVYSLSPHVFPIYQDYDSRGLVSMHVLREKLEPLPEVPAGIAVQDLLKFGGAAKYKAGTEYRVVVDMIPDYVIANKLQTKFCIYEAKFPVQGKGRDAWNLIKANPAPIQYRVDIPGLSFAGETELFHPQRTFYEGFLKQGAFDCGSSPNVNF
jgi:hypothetical protein